MILFLIALLILILIYLSFLLISGLRNGLEGPKVMMISLMLAVLIFSLYRMHKVYIEEMNIEFGRRLSLLFDSIDKAIVVGHAAETAVILRQEVFEITPTQWRKSYNTALRRLSALRNKDECKGEVLNEVDEKGGVRH